VGLLSRIKASAGDAVLVLLSVVLAGPISDGLDKVLSKDAADAASDLLAILIAGLVVFSAYEALLSRPELVVDWASAQRAGGPVVTDTSPAIPVGRNSKWEVRVSLRTSSLLAVLATAWFRRKNARFRVCLGDVAGTLELTLESTSSNCISEGPQGRGFDVDLDRGLPTISWQNATNSMTREIGRCKVSGDALPNAHGAKSTVEMYIVRDSASWFWNYAVSVKGTVRSIRADS
jgi:hypothetical protein